MAPPDGLLDLLRQNIVLGNVPDVVHVPVKAGEPVEHFLSIYKNYIYAFLTRTRRRRHLEGWDRYR